MILAIDTATDFAGLALYDHNKLWAEEIWYAARNHTVEVLPRLARMLAKAQLSVEKLEGIAVAIGPGSYTGVRVGVSLAKGLALPHNVSVVGVETLEITAYPHRNDTLPIVAIAQAGRKRILVARYDPAVQNQTQAPYITTFTALAPQLNEACLVTGELDSASVDYLRKHSPVQPTLLGPLHRVRRPGVLAELGYLKLSNAVQDDLDGLIPIYVKSG